MPTVKTYQSDPVNEQVRAFQLELKAKFPQLRVTSDFRPGAKTEQGKVSRHALGEAIDIAPDDKIFDYLYNSEEGLGLLNKYGLGLLDERSPEMLKKTGGSGAHIHLGKDLALVEQTKKRYSSLFGQKQQETYPQDFTHLYTKVEIPTFTEEIKTEEPEPKVQEAKQELTQKQGEKQFIEDYLAGNIQPQQEKQITPEQQQPTADIMQQYGQVSEFVDNFIMQKGGKVQYVDSVLTANKNLDFVKRLYQDNPQTLQIPGEKYKSTHLMSYDPKSKRVFPTIININGKLVQLKGNDAWDYADKAKEYIEFKTPEEAKWFAENGYKQGTNVLKTFQKGGEIPVSEDGVFAYPKERVIVPLPNKTATMVGVEYPIMAISQETGQRQLMLPGVESYFFPNTKSILEIPVI